MRFYQLVVMTFALTASTSFAAPVKRSLLSDIQGAANAIGNVINSNATVSGVVGTVVQSIDNPQLTAARLNVIKSLGDTQSSLSQISTQANNTGNVGVSNLVPPGQAGVSSAHDAVDRIGQSLVSGNKPSTNDQKLTAEGIKAVRDAVNQMSAAITTPDSTLSSLIATAQTNVQSLQAGGQGVLSAAGLTFADLGLPDDFATS